MRLLFTSLARETWRGRPRPPTTIKICFFSERKLVWFTLVNLFGYWTVMTSIKSLSLLFVFGEYYLSLRFCLTRFLLALYVSTMPSIRSILFITITFRVFWRWLLVLLEQYSYPSVKRLLLTLLVLYSVMRSSPFVFMKGTLTAWLTNLT